MRFAFSSLMGFEKVYKGLLWIQGSYTLLTALWAIVDIDSFMRVTGPKTDIWLVKTVSVVLAAIGISLLVHASAKEANKLPAAILGMTTALGLAIIDFYYSGNEVISMIYAIDGVMEVVFFVIWIYILATEQNKPH
ncbi:MAG TPA: hypothetical protein VGD33_04460 [Chitinophagaceae bacterium]